MGRGTASLGTSQVLCWVLIQLLVLFCFILFIALGKPWVVAAAGVTMAVGWHSLVGQGLQWAVQILGSVSRVLPAPGGSWAAFILPFANRVIKLKPSCASKVPLSLAVNICADVSKLEAPEKLLLDLLGRAGICYFCCLHMCGGLLSLSQLLVLPPCPCPALPVRGWML